MLALAGHRPFRVAVPAAVGRWVLARASRRPRVVAVPAAACGPGWARLLSQGYGGIAETYGPAGADGRVAAWDTAARPSRATPAGPQRRNNSVDATMTTSRTLTRADATANAETLHGTPGRAPRKPEMSPQRPTCQDHPPASRDDPAPPPTASGVTGRNPLTTPHGDQSQPPTRKQSPRGPCPARRRT
ncbi:hypothetical protein Areg01_66620 [Actinoplanes regularis]|nr:hypothetical protein Areg01_66620 [Actinoplanes regularis]